VVIIGGGFAGSEVAKSLERLMKVHLIDTKEFFEFTPSVLRTIVHPEKVNSIQVFHKEYLKHTTLHHGVVQSILPSENKVSFLNKETNEQTSLEYDYLVISSGTSYNRPFKNPNVVISTRGKDFVECSKRLHSAKSIAIIGGGYVGVELAGELVDLKIPNQEITIIQGGSTLLSRQHNKTGECAQRFLENNRVNLMFNQRVDLNSFVFQESNLPDEPSPVCFSTTSGRTITADLAFICTGIWPNSDFLRNGEMEPDLFGQNGFILVNEFLQSPLLGSNVFVCGDVANLQEEKLAQAAGNSASVVVQNVLKSVKDSVAELKTYIPRELPIIVSLGKYDAIFTWKDYVLKGFLFSLAKEFVEWKVMVTF